MSDELTFLPWLRRGLAQALTTPDPLSGAIARGPAVTASVDVLVTSALARDVRLHGPDRVTGLAPGSGAALASRAPTASRSRPRSSRTSSWRRPTCRGSTRRRRPGDAGLRPWLVLVVVREQEGVQLDTPRRQPAAAADRAAGGGSRRAAGSRRRPGPGRTSSRWSGSTAPRRRWRRRTGEVVARLLCPRRLLPDSAWLACVVPAFDGGVLAGRGEPCPTGPTGSRRGTSRPGAIRARCPSTTTGASAPGARATSRRCAAGSAARRQRRARSACSAMDVSDPGLIGPSAQARAARLRGRAANARRRAAPVEATHKAAFQSAVPTCSQLDPAHRRAAAGSRRAATTRATQDPVVGPPLYGQWPAGVERRARATAGCAS